ncbi:MAG: cytidine deaminase [Bifidobacteriaceae bacterium]|jgi:cytidine deaminase|nr:cytidine deaminase [Bifidobacteriaceae bacterium]
MENIDLIKQAVKARNNSYSPYSDFAVGAAVYCDENMVHLGCNVENAAYPATICAERNAIVNMVAQGMQRIIKIAIVGGFVSSFSKNDNIVSPCGLCRQVIREFCEPEKCQIIMASLGDLNNIIVKTLAELLPLSFGSDNLAK